jgi:hypothetical protein
MYKTISNAIIRQFKPCYDPLKIITDETEELTVKQWVEKYMKVVPAKDILWLLLRKEFMPEKDLRLFAVWCAREALKLVEIPDKRSIEACNVAERYANGEATKEELLAAYDAAHNAAYAVYIDDHNAYSSVLVAYYAATYAARDTANAAYYAADAAYYAADAASDAASYAGVYYAARDAQLEQLLTYFE